MIMKIDMDNEEIQVISKRLMDKNEEVYNIMENMYVVGSKENYDWLMESKAQLENGQYAVHDLIEEDADPDQ